MPHTEEEQNTVKATDKVPASDKELTEFLERWGNSRNIRQTTVEPAAVRYQKIMKGISIQDKTDISKTTGRVKLYFRKAWSAVTRIVASLYQSFLKDANKFKVIGRDEKDDFIRAKLLEKLASYRLERFFRRDNGYTKLLTGLQECVSPGFSAAKVTWQYLEDDEGKTLIDKPDIVNYPLEHIALDWYAGSLDRMRYIYLENYLTKDEMEELGYDNIDKMVPIELPESELRQLRFRQGITDPRSNTAQGSTGNYTSGAGGVANGTVGLHYPKPGNDPNDQPISFLSRYRIVECWYKKNGVVIYAAANADSVQWAVKPKKSEWGSVIPVALGSMLLEPHKLIPESIIETVIGPQESLNMGLNLRKENQMLAMQGGFLFDRGSGVNAAAFKNVFPGWSVATDNINGVVPLKYPDVTQTAYVETNADQLMIEEMMGVTDAIQGQSKTGKTGEAQLNAALSQVKLDLFISNISQTYFQQLMYLWVYTIQLFETDEKVFKVANERLEADGFHLKNASDFYDINFDMDVEVKVGLTEIGRQARFSQMQAIVQMMNQSNQVTVGMLAQGIQPQDKPAKLYDVSEVLTEYLPDFGLNNPNRFIYAIIPPPQEQGKEGAGGQGGAAAQGAQGNVPQTAQNGQAQGSNEETFQKALQNGLGQQQGQ